MSSQRRCSRSGCLESAVATLTYVYADSTAVLGPLATFPEPHTYDLCDVHARRMTAPRGWDLVRQEDIFSAAKSRTDDLAALADAVREAAHPPAQNPLAESADPGDQSPRRGHLRVLPAPQ